MNSAGAPASRGADAPTPDPPAAALHLVPPGSPPAPLACIAALAERLTTVGVPGRVAGVEPPDVFLPFGIVQVHAHSKTEAETRERMWRYLVEQARDHGGDWHLLVVGVAKRLRMVALKLAPKRAGPQRIFEAHQHLAAEFLLALDRVDLNTPNVGARLVGMARYWATQALYGRRYRRDLSLDAIQERYPDLPVALSRSDDAADAEYAVLTRLVQGSADRSPSRTDLRPKLTHLDAQLIARCRLGTQGLADAAQALGITHAAARNRLPRAERAVRALLAEEAAAEAAQAAIDAGLRPATHPDVTTRGQPG
jgi:hypothetical protein